jgi:hypothetical protein
MRFAMEVAYLRIDVVSQPRYPKSRSGWEKGVRNRLRKAPSGPFRQTLPDPFFQRLTPFLGRETCAIMRFFLAGIMQGSHQDTVLHDQGYRQRLAMLLRNNFPDAEVYDPLADHQNSLDYDDVTGREVFFRHNRLCREVDVVIAFVPEASMGTAIEMWEAHEHGRGVVVTISPLSHNWAVRFCSHIVYPDFAALEADAASGEFARQITAALARRREASRGQR